MNAVYRFILSACSTLVSFPALPGEPFDGRWVADPLACARANAAAPLLDVSSLSLRWGDAACVVRTSYRVRDACHIDARCWGEGAISNVPISLRMRGEHLLPAWAGTPAEKLWRCR